MLTIRTADHLVERDEPDAAADILQRYLAAHPPHGRVLQRLGRVRLIQGRAAEAAVLLEQALDCRAAAPVPLCEEGDEASAVRTPSAAAQ